MELPRNEFKRAIAEGRQQIGLWCTLPGSFTVEALATCGYDWLLIDTEHSPGDPLTVLPQLQAAAAYPVSTVVRPASNDAVLIKRILDFGAQTLLIPYVQNAREAQAAVDACAIRRPASAAWRASRARRATEGCRTTRRARRRNSACSCRPRAAAALDEIEAIAAIDGMDGIFIGPADLSSSLGHPGDPAHPEVVAAIEDAIRRIRKAGKPAGILTTDKAFARHCMDLGTVFTAVDVDANILIGNATRIAEEFKETADEPVPLAADHCCLRTSAASGPRASCLAPRSREKAARLATGLKGYGEASR